jgi:DNA-binding SARP family transcriptional activator
MAGLSLELLGSFRIKLDGASLEGLSKSKLGGLLAYLAFEHDRAHHREALAAMLWPEHDEDHARNNLRQALFKLKALLQEPETTSYIKITRDTVQFTASAG